MLLKLHQNSGIILNSFALSLFPKLFAHISRMPNFWNKRYINWNFIMGRSRKFLGGKPWIWDLAWENWANVHKIHLFVLRYITFLLFKLFKLYKLHWIPHEMLHNWWEFHQIKGINQVIQVWNPKCGQILYAHKPYFFMPGHNYKEWL